MQIDTARLMPQMQSTNSGASGSGLLNKEKLFQAELETAQKRIEKAKKTGIMTQEDIDKRNKDIRDASVQMEALMLKIMYGEMWKTVPKDELFGDDNAMDIYRDMYHDELTKQWAKDGGIGLADFIYQQLTRSPK